MIRVAVADDHPIVLAGLKDLLGSAGGFEVVAACSNGREALAAARSESPDVLILDLRMPLMSGLDVLRALSGDSTRPRAILLTAEVEGSEAQRALALGADALLLKDSAIDELVDCARALYQGQSWGTDWVPPAPLRTLSPLAREAAVLLAYGGASRQIASQLGIREAEAASLITALGAVLEVHSDEQGIREACRRLLGTHDTMSARERRLQDRFSFTRREAAVASLLSDGLTNREIASHLGITLNTVKTHISNIHAKSDVSTTRRLLVVLSEAWDSDV